MPRPLRPLLSRELVVSTALGIIDEDGLDALSLPRLARELNVRAPSLYHHFADKAEILRAVARAIVLETSRPPAPSVDDWVEWFVEICQSFRRTILRHANAAPVLLQFMPRDVMAQTYEASAQVLSRVGVPEHLQVLILDGVDTMTLGAGTAGAMKTPAKREQIFPSIGPDLHPTLVRAVAANPYSSDELFEASIRGFLHGVTASLAAGPSVAPRGLTAGTLSN